MDSSRPGVDTGRLWDTADVGGGAASGGWMAAPWAACEADGARRRDDLMKAGRRAAQRAPIQDPAREKEADLAAKRCMIGQSLYDVQTIMTGSIMQAKERWDVLICRETGRRAVKRCAVLPASRQRAPADTRKHPSQAKRRPMVLGAAWWLRDNTHVQVGGAGCDGAEGWAFRERGLDRACLG